MTLEQAERAAHKVAVLLAQSHKRLARLERAIARHDAIDGRHEALRLQRVAELKADVALYAALHDDLTTRSNAA